MTSSNRCSICKKINGICSCAGCKAYFCGKDFTEHREGLRNELDGLSDDSNDLKDKINKTPQSNESHISLLTRIDEWQQTTIEKVKQMAEEARKEIIKLMTSEKIQLTNQLESLIQQFKELRETEGFVEQDLARLKQIIHQLNEDFKNLTQLTIIELHATQSDKIPWNQFINVRYKKSACNRDQKRLSFNLTSSALSTSQIPLTSSENINSSFFTPDQQKLADEKTSVQLSSPASNTKSQYDNKPSIFGNFNGSSSIFGGLTPLTNTSSSVFGSRASLKPSTNTNSGFPFPCFGNSATTPTAGFQFSTPAGAPTTTTSTANTNPTFSFGSTNTPLFGSAPKFSFSGLAKQSSSTNNDKPTTNVFSGQGSLVFGTNSVNTPTTTKNHEDEDGDENESYEPSFPFKQIVQLSPVEVKTGEEDENVLFCERAKLYRFDAESNQMKERGVGEMKILQHKTTKVCRVLMRREHVLKLCANHQITSQMKLKPHRGSENAYVWSAMDFADGEAKHETLCVRFKLGDVAKRFIKEFNEAKQANVNVHQ